MNKRTIAEVEGDTATAAVDEASERIAQDAAESMAYAAKPFYHRPAVIGSIVGILVIPAATFVLYELFKPEAEPVFDN